jgi:DNA primase
MDYLTLYQAGIRNAAAVSGTAFTTEHAQMITRFTQKVVLVFDGDRAGRSAAQRAVFVLAPSNINVSVLTLPGDDDPDSFVKREGGGGFLKLLSSSAKPAADFLIDKLVSESDGSPHAKSGVVDELIPYAHAISDTIVRDDFLAKLAMRLNIDRKRVLERFNANKNYVSPYGDTPAPPANGFNVGITLGALEESFLRILITSPKLIIQAKQHIQPGMLTDDLSANIYSIILEEYERDSNLGGLAETCSNNPAIGNAVSMLAVKPALTENIEDELVQKILLLHRKFLKTRMSELTESLKNCPEEEKVALLERLKDYGARLKELE